MADVEALTPNAHVGVIRALIARHDLYYQGAPISPGTGDRNGRTKFDMLQEVRHAVGADPLPDSALRARRAKPDVPMGKPVTRLDGHRIDFGSPKAPRGAEPDVERKSMCGITCGAPFLLAMLGQLLMVCMSMHANGNFVSCRTISPSWVCKSLGYIDPALAAMPNTITPKIGSLPGDDAFVREPGAQMYEQVGTDVRHTGLHLLLPLLACLVLLFHTLGVTAHFASRRLTRRARAWVARQDPLRAIPPRDARRHTRRRDATTACSASNFVSTLGDAPLWLSLMFLMHEIAIYVVPYLFALSIGTLLIWVCCTRP
jgi:hypothetical protein